MALRSRTLKFAFVLIFAAVANPTAAQTVGQTHDEKLLRLAELLGAVHHLREICGANEGQLWRDQMMAVLGAEDPPGQLRGRMVAAFNNGYRGYQRTYAACTPSAKTAAERFFAEGATIAQGLVNELTPKEKAEKLQQTADPDSQRLR